MRLCPLRLGVKPVSEANKFERERIRAKRVLLSEANKRLDKKNPSTIRGIQNIIDLIIKLIQATPGNPGSSTYSDHRYHSHYTIQLHSVL